MLIISVLNIKIYQKILNINKTDNFKNVNNNIIPFY